MSTMASPIPRTICHRIRAEGCFCGCHGGSPHTREPCCDCGPMLDQEGQPVRWEKVP